jgi:hypothetical protein
LSAIGATAGAKLGEGPFPFSNGERCYGLRHALHAAGRNLVERLSPACALQTASADEERRHLLDLRANAFRRDLPSHRLVLYNAMTGARYTRSNSYDSLGVGY